MEPHQKVGKRHQTGESGEETDDKRPLLPTDPQRPHKGIGGSRTHASQQPDQSRYKLHVERRRLDDKEASGKCARHDDCLSRLYLFL